MTTILDLIDIARHTMFRAFADTAPLRAAIEAYGDEQRAAGALDERRRGETAKSGAWPHDASDRVHQLMGELAAKELECQRLREALRER